MIKVFITAALLMAISCEGERVVEQSSAIPSLRNEILIRLRACTFIYKCLDNPYEKYGVPTVCLFKWHCPSSFK